MRWMHLKSWGFKMKVLVYGYGLMGKKIAHKVRSQNDMELMGIVSKADGAKPRTVLVSKGQLKELFPDQIEN